MLWAVLAGSVDACDIIGPDFDSIGHMKGKCMTTADVSKLVQRLGMMPHPEGGFYVETYRAADRVNRGVDGASRVSSTAIYYLLDNEAYSAWHRIASDEVWHFYAGTPLNVHVLTPQGDLVTHHLGNALENPAQVFQAIVPAGCWFAAELAQPGGYALVGCTVAPGFEFAEFELAQAEVLLANYPQHDEIIRRLLPGRTLPAA